jgi:hypothetical protein
MGAVVQSDGVLRRLHPPELDPRASSLVLAPPPSAARTNWEGGALYEDGGLPVFIDDTQPLLPVAFDRLARM